MSELSHGILLQEQGKMEEAEACFRSVLAQEPENDFVYNRLALCLLDQEGKKTLALDSIGEAIRIQPEYSFHHAIKSLILASLRRGKEGLEASEVAIALDPEDSFSLATKANAYCAMDRWAEGEKWSRRALAADSDNSMAANLLTHTLRMQGKSDLNAIAVDQMLAANPESDIAHINAGWTALQRGDHRKAEEHFREALRLDPDCDHAREGLVESFRARSPLYRAYLSYCFFMQRFTGGKQWMIIIGIYLVYRFASKALQKVSPLLAGGLTFLWLALVMWVWLAPGIGNLLILLDRNARLALRSSERAQGIAIGGGLILGLIAIGVGFGFDSSPAILGGFGLLISTVPASLSFDNESVPGRIVFGSITAYIYLATIVIVVLEMMNQGKELHAAVMPLATIGVLAAVICTWLGNVPALRRKKEI